ncbi:MAG: hypothetical protein NT030_08395 [Candidatus Saganbacteria bacterium]|nr:hypothetical protein [Candidatus Saganbacteria bacterium]
MGNESQPVKNNNNPFQELNPGAQVIRDLKKALGGENRVGPMGQQRVEGNILSAKPEIENRQNEDHTQRSTEDKYERFGPKGIVC